MARRLTPPHLTDVWPDADWSNEALWALDLPQVEMPVAELAWILDHPIWSSRPPEPRFDLCPRQVMDVAEVHPEHAARIEAADFAWPLLVYEHRGRTVVIDGLHRLARAVGEGRASVRACLVPPEALGPDA